ncbi:MAG: hypothetical protein ACYTBY_08065 [Planctomycetota bacterium]|jgi:hypothetical protein
MATSDIWAITPSTSATLLRAAATISGAGDITLLTNDVSPYGTGYKLLFTSVGNDAGITFTITGVKVGDLSGASVTEEVAGANAGTASSTNFYTSVSNISVDGASAGNVSIGTTGSLAFGRTRLKSLYYVGAGTAGSIKFNLNSSSGTLLLQIDTPVSSTSFSDSVTIPELGILTQRSNSTDFAVMTLDQVSNVTVFCG